MGNPRAFTAAQLFVLCLAGIGAASCGDDPNSLAGGRTGASSSSGSSGDDPGDGTSSSSGTDDGASSSSGSSAAGGTSAAQICVDTINAYRSKLGLPPYERWDSAEPCADGEAKSDGSTGAAHGAFGQCEERAQNECPGWPGAPEEMIPDCLKAMWGEGPGGGHYENMVSTRYTKVACGFAKGGRGTWSVQNFR